MKTEDIVNKLLQDSSKKVVMTVNVKFAYDDTDSDSDIIGQLKSNLEEGIWHLVDAGLLPDAPAHVEAVEVVYKRMISA
jgi:hypothetical protein